MLEQNPLVDNGVLTPAIKDLVQIITGTKYNPLVIKTKVICEISDQDFMEQWTQIQNEVLAELKKNKWHMPVEFDTLKAENRRSKKLTACYNMKKIIPCKVSKIGKNYIVTKMDLIPFIQKAMLN